MGGRSGSSGMGKGGGGGKFSINQTKEFMGGKMKTVYTLTFKNSEGGTMNYRYTSKAQAEKAAKQFKLE